jgi:hypothetical protein
VSLGAEFNIGRRILKRVIDSIELGRPVIPVIYSLYVIPRGRSTRLVEEAVKMRVILLFNP